MKESCSGNTKGKLLVAMAALCLAGLSHAQCVLTDLESHGDWSPLSVSLLPTMEFPPESWDVYGLRVNIFAGKHHDVGGLDVGTFANFATGEAIGLQAAGLYIQADSGNGLIQVAGIADWCKDGFVGLQTAGIFSRTDNTLTGCQLSMLSSAGTLEGIQFGLFNRAEGVFGLQIGAVNYAYQAEGVQIGLINIIADAQFPVLPVINVGF